MLISLGLEKYLLRHLFGFSRKSEGHSPNMDLRGDCSYMSLGWRLGYLDEHSHSSLLVLNGLILERYSPLFLSGALYLCLSFMDMDLEL